MGLQISASKSELLLQCARPFDPKVVPDEREVGEAADYGSAFHEVIAGWAQGQTPRIPDIFKSWGVRHDGEVTAHLDQAWGRLSQWLAKSPWGALEVEAAEVPYATKLTLGAKTSYISKSRICDFDKETHTYDLRKGEFGGTFDLLLRARVGRELGRIVLDIKTGNWGDFSRPSLVPQLRTLALQTGAIGVAVLHTPRGLPPVIYAEDIESKDLEAHAAAMVAAMARVGDGSLRLGDACKYCPAKLTCPAKQGEVLVSAGAIVKAATGTLSLGKVSRGQLHMMLGELDKLAKLARSELREAVRAGEIIQRPDGKVLALKTREQERLSKASVVRALGKKEGEKMIEKLRKLGCVEQEEQEMLVAEDDR